MNKIKNISVGIPVYNEEKTIIKCLDSVYNSLKLINGIDFIVIICFNGTTDNSKKIIQNKINDYPNLIITSSKKGKTKAICKILENSKETDICIFIDSDAIMDKKCITNIINKFNQTESNLLCVTGNPIPLSKTFLSKIINIRRIYPKSQIPPKSFEKFEKQRNYIHGRIYSLKNTIFGSVLKSTFRNSKGDDSYLSYFLIKNYGRESFIESDLVNVYYTPVLSLRGWWYKHTRIWSDHHSLQNNQLEFRELKKYMDCKIDWSYVFKQKMYIILFFISERILTYSGKIVFKLTKNFINYGWKRIDETKR
ncbi:MAG: glycosyltransferase [Candidatus Woesearchaeota archaeon]|jgi:glycosyltransferase involved in cell wall biosynthesis|nr:glycosyltransferase [Candidatus Woesearchaeota archaeon]